MIWISFLGKLFFTASGFVLLASFIYGILCGLYGWDNKINKSRKRKDDIIWIEPLDYGDVEPTKVEKALQHRPEQVAKHIPSHLKIYRPQ